MKGRRDKRKMKRTTNEKNRTGARMISSTNESSYEQSNEGTNEREHKRTIGSADYRPDEGTIEREGGRTIELANDRSDQGKIKREGRRTIGPANDRSNERQKKEGRKERTTTTKLNKQRGIQGKMKGRRDKRKIKRTLNEKKKK